MTDMQKIARLAILVGVIGLVLGSFFGAVGDVSREQIRTPVAIQGGTADLQGTNVSVDAVNQSLGQAAKLDGSSNSYVSGAESPDLDGNWTISTGVSVDNTTGTRILYSDTERVILYNGTTDAYVGVWYEPESGRTWSVSQGATDPTNQTVVMLMLETGTLEIIEDNTFSSTTATNDANAVNTTFTGDNLNGTVDETRAFNDSLTSSERQQLVDNPTAPLTTAPRAYRVMYDSFDPSPSGYPAIYVPGGVSASNVQQVEGFDGEPTERGTDWSLSGGDVVALAGGSLDGAPLVYVDYLGTVGALAGVLETLGTVANSGVQLLAVGVIVAAAAVLLKIYDDF